MVGKKQKKQMFDFLVSKLESSAEKVVPRTKKIVEDLDTNYILIDDRGLVISIDQHYTAKRFEELLSIIQRQTREGRNNIAYVFYKDGETFFRSAAKDNHFKSDKGLSLKNYDNEEMRRIMLLRPEEIMVRERRKFLQYYQPESQRLEEGIETFGFDPVIYNYSHIPEKERFGPLEKPSERLHIWTERHSQQGDLRLIHPGYLKSREQK
jgi:hypothetical protein